MLIILPKCARGCVSSVALGLSFLTLIRAHFLQAAEPDVPQIRAGAESGSVRKEIELGAAYFVGRGVPQNEQLAAYWYEKAANAGDPNAQRQIGYFYQVGIGVSKDPARAVHWYELASASGLPGAKVNLGVAYLWGVGVPKDEALAARLFREAAKKGSGIGACYLGGIYQFGMGAQKDVGTAKHWYVIGAGLHDPRSEFMLGSLYSAAENHKPNLKKTAKLWRQAANHGFVPAKHELGLLLAKHPELATSSHEAITLLTDASEAGTWKSSVVLGVLARDGRGMPVDLQAAYYHFRVAELQGGQVAHKLVANDIRTLAGQMSAEQAQTIDLDASGWFQRHQRVLRFVYKDGDDWEQFPAFALTEPEGDLHAGRLIATPPF